MKHTLTLLTALLLAPLAALHAAPSADAHIVIASEAGAKLDSDVTKGGTLELRRGSPTGPVLASIEVKPSGQADSGEFLSLPATLTNVNGLTDVCVVARCADKNTELGLNWIEFLP